MKNHDENPVKGLSEEALSYYYPLMSIKKKESKIRTSSLDNNLDFMRENNKVNTK